MLRLVSFVGVFLLGMLVCSILPTPFHMGLFSVLGIPMTLSLLIALSAALLVAIKV